MERTLSAFGALKCKLGLLSPGMGPQRVTFFFLLYSFSFLVRHIGPLTKKWTKSDEFSVFGSGYLGAPMHFGPLLEEILATPLAITGSNIDLGPKIIPPTASTRRPQSAGLFREALRRFVWKRQGGSHPPPPTPAKVGKHRLRARVKGRVSPF